MTSLLPRPQPPDPGFSLLELLVSAAMSALVILGVASLWGDSTRMFQQLKQRNTQEARVDEDIALMEDLAYRYTCCPGSCTTDATTINAAATCRGLGGNGTPAVGTEYYYFPYYLSTASSAPAIDSMETVCRNGTLITNLVTALSASSASRLSEKGITRTVVADNAAAHRVRIDYSGTNLKRSTMLVPTVARWCP